MAVQAYNPNTQGNTQLGNFRASEFRCRCFQNPSAWSSSMNHDILICDDLLRMCNALRNYFGKPMNINSAHRHPAYNTSVGGATGSLHVGGFAADTSMVASGVSTIELARAAESFGILGIGEYPNSQFVHIDSRATKWFWRTSGNNSVSTFGGTPNSLSIDEWAGSAHPTPTEPPQLNWIVTNTTLSEAEFYNNAQLFTNYMLPRGFTFNAVVGMLANIWVESRCNPGRWQSGTGPGFGLVQWDPASRFTNWANAEGYEHTSPVGQMEWIHSSFFKNDSRTNQWGYWSVANTPAWVMQEQLTPLEFARSTWNPDRLMYHFLWAFERPSIPHTQQRLDAIEGILRNIDPAGGGRPPAPEPDFERRKNFWGGKWIQNLNGFWYQ